MDQRQPGNVLPTRSGGGAAAAGAIRRRAARTSADDADRVLMGPHQPHAPGLDGLRSLAVAMGVVYHARAPWLPVAFPAADRSAAGAPGGGVGQASYRRAWPRAAHPVARPPAVAGVGAGRTESARGARPVLACASQRRPGGAGFSKPRLPALRFAGPWRAAAFARDASTSGSRGEGARTQTVSRSGESA